MASTNSLSTLEEAMAWADEQNAVIAQPVADGTKDDTVPDAARTTLNLASMGVPPWCMKYVTEHDYKQAKISLPGFTPIIAYIDRYGEGPSFSVEGEWIAGKNWQPSDDATPPLYEPVAKKQNRFDMFYEAMRYARQGFADYLNVIEKCKQLSKPGVEARANAKALADWVAQVKADYDKQMAEQRSAILRQLQPVIDAMPAVLRNQVSVSPKGIELRVKLPGYLDVSIGLNGNNQITVYAIPTDESRPRRHLGVFTLDGFNWGLLLSLQDWNDIVPRPEPKDPDTLDRLRDLLREVLEGDDN